jgi:hypothetical protein
MKSNFLSFMKQTLVKKHLSLVVILIAFSLLHSNAQEIPVQTEPLTDQMNNIRYYLMKEAAKITDSRLEDLNSLDDWKKIRPVKHRQLVEMLGMQDVPLEGTRPDLNVKVTGVIQKDGYRIEKLYYESLPDLYVPANLYIPDNIKEPRPAILYVCGHSRTQKVYYQDHPRKFAQLGFVCLIIETIQNGEVRGEHHGCYANGWFNWYSRGYNPGGVEVWNGIRGIDLLAARPEVDKERIGVTGNSGGGAQSWFIPAIDSRVKATAPSCGASTLKAHLLTRTIDGHCDCMMPVNTYECDFQDIGALIAPRPLLVAQSDGDGLNQIESVRQIHNDLYKIYGLYGNTENNRFIEYPGGHGYQPVSRKTIFSFFINELMDKDVSPEEAGDIDTSPEVNLPAEELQVYIDGPPADDHTKYIQDSFVRLAAPPDINNQKELTALKNSVITFLREKTFRAFPTEKADFSAQHVFHTTDRAKSGIDTYSFVTEEGWRLKMNIRWNYPPYENKPLMIVLRNRSEKRGESEKFISDYLEEEWNVAFLEVRGVGETAWHPDLQWHVRRASAWTGRTIASMQVYDLLRCLEFCRTLDGVSKIGIAAQDNMGVIALYASLLDGNCHTLLLKNPPESQDTTSRPDGTGPAIEMLNCLQVTDVYQLPALLPSVDIRFIGEIPEAYLWSENIRKKMNGNEFKVIN